MTDFDMPDVEIRCADVGCVAGEICNAIYENGRIVCGSGGPFVGWNVYPGAASPISDDPSESM